jgi:hypothetical protein
MLPLSFSILPPKKEDFRAAGPAYRRDAPGLCDVLRTQHHVEVEVIERRRRRQIRLGGRHAVREHPAPAGWQITLKAGAAAAPSTPASEKRGFSGI